MFSTCIFCNQSLGTNATFESFPVGRRIAFDAAKGRLWVICRKCERWNLSPLEERWEAVEEAERLYHDTRRRVATPEIGLARLADGTELVRIGAPLRPEFAAWRYGDQFGRRRNRQMLIAGAGLAAIGGLVVGGVTAGVGIGGFGWMIVQAARTAIYGGPETVVARVRTDSGQVLPVRRRHLAESSITHASDGALAIELRYKNGQSRFEGPEALRIASHVIPAVNRFGGSRQTVAAAVGEIEQGGGPERYVEQLARRAESSTAVTGRAHQYGRRGSIGRTGLYGLSTVDRLALEMALHEEAERRAMAGELAELERAWRDAEEIAAIADDLLVPSGVRATLERMRGK
ncbi:MAG TPA: hypothetical protein VFJ96_14885 [Gemmatimonadaceae bacterium]|nr:hypothetical protein [Gemmatimonadaceae bacterium]